MSQREILFKAKRTDNGKWVEGIPTYPEHEIGKCYMITRVHGMDERFGYGNRGNVLLIHDAYEVDPKTVCQYTGLTDKNGKNVFEGDIIIHDTKSLIDEKRFDKGTVVFDEETAQFARTSNDEKRLFEIWKRSKDDYEVIGNIHDN